MQIVKKDGFRSQSSMVNKSDDMYRVVVDMKRTEYPQFAKLVEGQKPTTNTQMAAALWRELKRRQSNGLVPLRVDWVAVTENRLNAAVTALRHL